MLLNTANVSLWEKREERRGDTGCYLSFSLSLILIFIFHSERKHSSLKMIVTDKSFSVLKRRPSCLLKWKLKLDVFVSDRITRKIGEATDRAGRRSLRAPHLRLSLWSDSKARTKRRARPLCPIWYEMASVPSLRFRCCPNVLDQRPIRRLSGLILMMKSEYLFATPFIMPASSFSRSSSLSLSSSPLSSMIGLKICR